MRYLHEWKCQHCTKEGTCKSKGKKCPYMYPGEPRTVKLR